MTEMLKSLIEAKCIIYDIGISNFGLEVVAFTIVY